MNQPSEEQQTVINHILNGSNVIVDACAGSGKSTTIISAAIQCKHMHILQCTYNKQLRLEVEQKVTDMNITNLDVHNYHSIAKKFYSKDGHTDTGIREILAKKIPPLKDISVYNLIVVDEAQDMTMLYFELLIKFTMDMPCKTFQLLILGDKMQGLYEFKGSDVRFLTLGESCWKTHPKLLNQRFEFCTLRMSYRITNEMSFFVNEAMLGHERLLACRSGPKVMYIRKDRYNMETSVVAMITQLIAQDGASYSDFFCLNASIKNSRFYNPVRKIENMLAERGIPCFIPNDESNEQLDNRVIERKVVFTTFHSVKGRQRKYVIVFGFDDSYFKFYARNMSPDICPNALYVACTRGTERLIVMEGKDYPDSRPLPFLRMSHHQMKMTDYVSFQGDPLTFAPLKKEKTKENEIKREISVTELLRFIPDHILDVITGLVQELFTTIREPEERFLSPESEIPTVIETKNHYFEDVSAMNGIALPIMFFDMLRKTQEPILQNIIEHNMKSAANNHSYLQREAAHMPKICKTSDDYLYLANLSIATQEKLYSKLKMIDRNEYSWLKENVINMCFERLEQTVGPECIGRWTPERLLIRYNDDLDHFYIDEIIKNEMKDKTTLYRFAARVDLMTKQSIWELKCTSELSFDHKLQLIIYTWLYYMRMDPEKREKKQRKSYLFNIKTGEWLQLHANLDQLTFIVVQLLHGKFHREEEKSDEVFIAEAMDSINEMTGNKMTV
uniref:Uncharacterized protein n=1 Tax=viral metagenome TaxID=1070528 RepID=A0A6C0HJV7_9ZZZZ